MLKRKKTFICQVGMKGTNKKTKQQNNKTKQNKHKQ